MNPWLHLAIALVVFCHGLIYVTIGSMLPGPVKDWRGQSWLLGTLLSDRPLTLLVVGLHVAAGAAIIGSAVMMGFAPWFPGWWRTLAVVGASLGIAAFAVFWDGQTGLLVEEGVGGAAISLVLLMAAVALPSVFR